MFARVLIANRGEIACRIIDTLRRMQIESVAVYSEADTESRHVHRADHAVLIGPAPARQSYLDVEALLAAAKRTGAAAVHPGYGFLSENAAFAERVEAEGLAFIGPTAEQIRSFGLKHTARRLAQAASVPLLPGSELLSDPAEARRAAAAIGYPVMLKSTGGGGGIGLSLCQNDAELAQAFESVQRLGDQHFAHSGVYLERYVERARHVEVQIFGDGAGNVVALGTRDCSLQRRNQKLVEETPATDLTPELLSLLCESALRLGRTVKYRSAGTVEFIVDVDRGQAYFLEVNTRLQVEHCVTEEVFGIDLVEWMVRLSAGDVPALCALPEPRGHAFQARLYAEDPGRDFRPCAGTLTQVRFPEHARIETWIDAGQDIPAHYDPLLAKIVVHAASRTEALDSLARALAETELGGLETNLDYLRQVVASSAFRSGPVSTQYLGSFIYRSRAADVLAPGTLTTLHDYPGRLGYWDVGIPPSGPMDDLAFRLANRIVGNPEGAPALELTVSGPSLVFRCDVVIALTGATLDADIDGEALPAYIPVTLRAGQTLRCGKIRGPGARAYLAVQHGFDAPVYLGSRATFTLGGFGGPAGRALRSGDVLRLAPETDGGETPRALPAALIPRYSTSWRIGVLYGPHGAPDFFTPGDIEQLFTAEWRVHYNSARTGVRLIGPKPRWARRDGGEAGLHPSNIHDSAYAVGAVDFTGDMPIILGPDGPSLGGFVCPATVVAAERWKLGQLRPGDTLTLELLSEQEAGAKRLELDRTIATFEPPVEPRARAKVEATSAVSAELPAPPHAVGVSYRRAGDDYLLIEYGPMALDLRLRLRVQALLGHIRAAKLAGIIDLTPGIRSLQIHFDDRVLPYRRLLDRVIGFEAELPAVDAVSVPSRIVHLPLSWDDAATRLAIEKYMQSVRNDAPWTPSNIEFIRRINGLSDIADVRRIVFDASYLVLGLGDVYLGAPVATPVDPRHRLVTTKYNPARTWTPENAVGIGGAYLCIYGMEGPGGYQFVGRTLQVYNRFRSTSSFPGGRPWLLDFFDQIRFYPVDARELLELRKAFVAGRFDVRIESGTFRLADYEAFLAANASSIAAFKAAQQLAFEQERERWASSGQLLPPLEPDALAPAADDRQLPEGAVGVDSPVSGSVWKLIATPGSRVARGAPLVVIESMKMEVTVEAPCDGLVLELMCQEGGAVFAGQPLLLLQAQAEKAGRA